MEPLLNQLKSLPQRYATLPPKFKTGIVVGAVLAVLAGIVGSVVSSSGPHYQYAYTDLNDADAQEAGQLLTAQGIPFRLEADGRALAVPANRVSEVRMQLATQGLPRGKAQVIESSAMDSREWEHSKLHRLREGELSASVAAIDEVRSARVHIRERKRRTLVGDDSPAGASVLVRLHPGRELNRKQVAGIRHMVAAAIPDLEPEGVSVIDGSGNILSGGGEQEAGGALEASAQLERGLESSILAVLIPVVGERAVVARVHATMDTSRVEKKAEHFDEDGVLRSERSRKERRQRGEQAAGGVAGAAANAPLDNGQRDDPKNNSSEKLDDSKEFLVGSEHTHEITTGPRLTRLTVAVLIDSPETSPLSAEQLKQLEGLVKQSAGFNAERGDTLSLVSMPFAAPVPTEEAPVVASTLPLGLTATSAAVLALVLAALLVGGGILIRRRRAGAEQSAALAVLEQGGSVAQLEAQMRGERIEPEVSEEITAEVEPTEAKVSPEQLLREATIRAVQEDPRRAAYLLRAWLREGTEVPSAQENEVARAA